MGRKELEEYWRCHIERLLASDLSVAEWCKRNDICRASMYKWLSVFAKSEPDLFGGKRNIADTSKRNWVEVTRKNISGSLALELSGSPGVLIVDTCDEKLPSTIAPPTHPQPSAPISVYTRGIEVKIPKGSSQIDIESVLKVVVSL